MSKRAVCCLTVPMSLLFRGKMKIRFVPILFSVLFFASTAYADFVEAIQGKVEKSQSGQIYINTGKHKYLVVGDFSNPEGQTQPSLSEMEGKKVLVTGVLVPGGGKIRSLRVSTVSELANQNLPGLMKWPTVK